LRPRRKEAAQASPKPKAAPIAIPVIAPGERPGAPQADDGGAAAPSVPVGEAPPALRGTVAL